jgi:hypothetical protein
MRRRRPNVGDFIEVDWYSRGNWEIARVAFVARARSYVAIVFNDGVMQTISIRAKNWRQVSTT